MQRLGLWSSRSIFYLTTALLLSAVVLRSILVYGTGPELPLVLALLTVWSVLFITEPNLTARWPAYSPIYLFLQTAFALLLLLQPGSTDSFAVLFFILSMQAVPRTGLRAALAWIALFIVLCVLAIGRAYGPVQGIVYGLIYAGGIAIFTSYAYAAQRAQAGRAHKQALAREMEAANLQLQQYSQQLEQLAAARARRQLARDLHDSVTQTIFSMTLTTQSALLLLDRDPGRVSAQLDRLNQLAQSALAEMRVLVSKLDRGPVTEQGLTAALREHVHQPELESLAISVEVQGQRSLSTAEEQGLYRIAQEALNNVAKHARTDRAWVRLCLEEPPWMEIEDRGCGFAGDPVSGNGSDSANGLDSAHGLDWAAPAREHGGVGLKSMRERAAEIGWTLEVHSHLGAGTRVRVEKRSA